MNSPCFGWAVHDPDTSKEPVAPPDGTHTCTVTFTAKSPCWPSVSGAAGYLPWYVRCGVTCVIATEEAGTSNKYTDFQMPFEKEFVGSLAYFFFFFDDNDEQRML